MNQPVDLPQLRRCWLPFRNDASETAPAFGIMRITGTILDKGLRLLTIDKPSTTFSRLYAVNGPSDVAAGARGRCMIHSPVEVLYDTGTPAVGEGWGPKPGQWTLSKNYPACVTVYGVADASSKRLYGSWQQINEALCKPNFGITKGNSGDVTIWVGDAGSEVASTWTSVHASAVWAGCSSNKFCLLSYLNGVAYVTPLECG